MFRRKFLSSILILSILVGLSISAMAQTTPKTPSLEELEKLSMQEWNNQIRLEKFDMVLPEAMRKNGVDMWIHVMRMAIPDEFGEEEFGSTSSTESTAKSSGRKNTATAISYSK